jgi:anthranilate phosphoribosyltransferase
LQNEIKFNLAFNGLAKAEGDVSAAPSILIAMRCRGPTSAANLTVAAKAARRKTAMATDKEVIDTVL